MINVLVNVKVVLFGKHLTCSTHKTIACDDNTVVTVPPLASSGRLQKQCPNEMPWYVAHWKLVQIHAILNQECIFAKKMMLRNNDPLNFETWQIVSSCWKKVEARHSTNIATHIKPLYIKLWIIQRLDRVHSVWHLLTNCSIDADDILLRFVVRRQLGSAGAACWAPSFS